MGRRTLMVTTCLRRMPDPNELNTVSSRLAVARGLGTGSRKRDDIRRRSPTRAPHLVTNFLTDQHHDQTSTKYNRASENGDLIIGKLNGK